MKYYGDAYVKGKMRQEREVGLLGESNLRSVGWYRVNRENFPVRHSIGVH